MLNFVDVDYSGHFILLCRKTIATMIITVLKNYMCTRTWRIVFLFMKDGICIHEIFYI